MSNTNEPYFKANNEGAKIGGRAGGKISRRPRPIKVGDKLTSSEMLLVASGISTILADATDWDFGDKGLEGTVRELSELLVAGGWDKVFLGIFDGNPVKSLAAWKDYLTKEWGKAYELVSTTEANDITEEDNEWLRALRNVSNAYDVATSTKTKWSQEGKKLLDQK